MSLPPEGGSHKLPIPQTPNPTTPNPTTPNPTTPNPQIPIPQIPIENPWLPPSGGSFLFPELHDFFRRFPHRVRRREVQAALLQHLLALLDVRAFHANDDRDPHAQLLHGGNHAFG